MLSPSLHHPKLKIKDAQNQIITKTECDNNE